MKNVHDELSRCIIKMLFKEPFFNHFLSSIVRVITDEIPTMAVAFSGNQVQLLVNEEFFLKGLRSESNRVAVVKHETLHLLFKHLFRKDLDKYDPEIFNIAADIVVNQFIGSWKLPESAVTLSSFPDLGLTEGQTVEWYYKRLTELRKEMSKQSIENSEQTEDQSGTGSDQGTSDGSSSPASADALEKILEQSSHSDHSKWGAEGSVEQANMATAETELERLVIQARERTPVKMWGTIPSTINNLINAFIEKRKPQIDWRRALRIFANSSRRTYVFSTINRISKRYGSRPGIKVKRYQKLAVAIDTSGSVSDEDISKFFAEINSMYRQGAEIIVIECDAAVHRTYRYNGTLPDRISGRGGTVFDPVFEHLRKNRLVRYDGCIYLTDGYANKPVISPPCPLLWVITSDGTTGNAKYGRAVKLKIQRIEEEMETKLSKEEKKHISSLKKLFRSCDNDLIMNGAELLASLDSISVYTAVLSGISYENNKLIPNKFFLSPTLIAEEYFNYAMVSAIALASENCAEANKLKKEITGLDMKFSDINTLEKLKGLKTLDLSGYSELQNVDGIKNCVNLETLNLGNCESLQNVEGVNNCENIETLNLEGCNSLQNVDGLVSLNKLKELKIFDKQFNSRDLVMGFQKVLKIYIALKNNDKVLLEKITSLDENILLLLKKFNRSSLPLGFGAFKNLNTLDLSSFNIQNVDGLKNCVNLETMNLKHCESLQNVDGIKNCIKLETLNLVGCRSLKNVDGLSGCSNLKNLELSGSFQNVDGLKNCVNLEKLNLSYCSELQNVDGLKNCVNLKVLDLRDCKSLENVNGLKNCVNLKALDLSGSYWSESILQNVDGLKNCVNLETLDLSNCSDLQNVDGLENCVNLKTLNLSFVNAYNSVLQNIDGLVNCVKLERLDFSEVSELSIFNDLNKRELVLEFLKALKFYIALKKDDEEFLKKYKDKTSLDEIVTQLLQQSKSKSLPPGFGSLTNLTTLDLSYCSELQNVDGLKNCVNLVTLNLERCRALQNVDGLKNCVNLETMNLKHCESLQNVDGLKNCVNLEKLDLSYCSELQNVDGLVNCVKLERLDFSEVSELSIFNDLNKRELVLEFLKALKFYIALKKDDEEFLKKYKDKTSLDEIVTQLLQQSKSKSLPPGFGSLTNLTTLDLSYCSELQNVDGLKNCVNLKELDLSSCSNLQNLDGLKNCVNLKALDLSGSYWSESILQNVDGLKNCVNLETLDLSNCSDLQNVDGLENCVNLKTLNLSFVNAYNSVLQNIDGLVNCVNLETLDLSNCSDLQNVDGLENCVKITNLNLSGCRNLENLEGLTKLTNLSSITIEDCIKLKSLKGLENAIDLEKIIIRGCKNLTDISAIWDLTNIKYINLRGNAAKKNKLSPALRSIVDTSI